MARTEPPAKERGRVSRASGGRRFFTFQRNAQTAPTSTVIASAALVERQDIKHAIKSGGWQAEAWDYYDTVSELHYAAGWVANGMGLCRLFVAETTEDDTGEPAPTENETARMPLEELLSSQADQGELLRRMGVHLSVPGETYLVGFDDPKPDHRGERRWLVLSANEIASGTGGQVRVRLPETDREVLLDDDKFTLIRIWRPHPRRAFEPDSPVLSLRPTLRELVALSKHVAASIDSRLAGAGVLVLPESASLPAPQESEGEPNPLHSDPFVATFIEAMITPLQNPDSAAAVVPIVIRVPDESAAKIQHLSFSTPLDSKVSDMRDAAINRIAIGLDLPPEIMTGMGESNHWGAWRIEESAIRFSIEPLLALICDSLTEHWLRPALIQLGITEPDRYLLSYDTAALTQRANRGPEAIALYDKGLLKGTTVVREHGFSVEDMPDGEEAARILARELVLRNPALAPILAQALGVEELTNPSVATGVTGELTSGRLDRGDTRPNTRGELPQSTLESATNGEGLPLQASGSQDHYTDRTAGTAGNWQITALEIAVFRALERAGNWLLSRQGRSARQQYVNVPLHELHTRIPAEAKDLDAMLNGAWREFCAACDSPCLQTMLDDYVRALLLAHHPHDRKYLATALTRAGCDALA